MQPRLRGRTQRLRSQLRRRPRARRERRRDGGRSASSSTSGPVSRPRTADPGSRTRSSMSTPARRRWPRSACSCSPIAARSTSTRPSPTYWPEFAQNGKGGVLVKHVMSHSAGLPGFDPPLEVADLYDWKKCCDNLAAQAPVVGARHRRRLPRRHAGLPAGRTRPPRRRPHARHVLPRGSGGPAQRRLPHRPRRQTRWPRRRTHPAGAPARRGLRGGHPGRPAHG